MRLQRYQYLTPSPYRSLACDTELLATKGGRMALRGGVTVRT